MADATSTTDIFTQEQLLIGADTELRSNNRHASDAERDELSMVAPLENMANGGNNNGHVVDIDEWVVTLARTLEEIPQYMCNPGHPGRIGRIPESLREVDVKSYEPCFVSIGPYHHGKTRLEQMDRRKQYVLKCVLENRPELSLLDYLKEIRTLEPEARSFYSDVEMNSEEFVRMLIVDSLYIITVFCNLSDSQESMNQENTRIVRSEAATPINQGTGIVEDNENMNAIVRADESSGDTTEQPELPRWFWILFMHDIFLIENQIPFFVLKKLYAFAYGGPESRLISIMKYKIGSMLWSYTNLDSDMVISPTEEVHHLLHLCHMFFRPMLRQESNDQLSESAEMFRLGSATQLYEAGVNFDARSDSTPHCLLDITFGSTGNMVMSSLQVDDNTISLLRNLIALEQMKYPSLGLNISAYAVLLLHLVTIPEDVKLLRRKGIIKHHLASDKEMVYLVNRLSIGLAFDYVDDKYSLKPVFRLLKVHTERRVPRWKAWLKHRYFNNPWTLLSLLAASLLLLLSFVQTYYTVYSYYYPCLDCHK